MGVRSWVRRKFLRRPPIPPEVEAALETNVVWASEELDGSEDPDAPIPPEGEAALETNVVWASEELSAASPSLTGSSSSSSSSSSSAPVGRSAAALWDAYETELTRLLDWPEDNQCRRRCADALCGYMRVRTDGQTVTIAGPGDPPEFRKVWRDHAPRALELYRALQRNGAYMGALSEESAADLLCNVIECQSSAASAKGVALASVTGDAARFLSSVKKLQAAHPDHNGGQGWLYVRMNERMNE